MMLDASSTPRPPNLSRLVGDGVLRCLGGLANLASGGFEGRILGDKWVVLVDPSAGAPAVPSISASSWLWLHRSQFLSRHSPLPPLSS